MMASAEIAFVYGLKVRIGYMWIQMLMKHLPNGKADNKCEVSATSRLWKKFMFQTCYVTSEKKNK